jgi:hypothetical protein
MKLTLRLREFWHEYQWPFIVGLTAAAVVLGWIGFWKHFAAVGEPRSPLDIAYTTLQLFTLESGSVSGPVPWELEIARVLAPVAAGFMAVKALAVLFREEFRVFWLRFRSDYVVICGLGRKGLLLARAFRELGDRVVVVEKDEGNDMIGPCRDDGAIVTVGDARDPHLLRRIRVERAKLVISVCGDDGVNAEVAVRTREIAERTDSRVKGYIHIVDPRLCTLLRLRGLSESEEEGFRLEYINFFEIGARQLLDLYSPLDRAEAEPQHVLLIGLGVFGETLLIELARRWRSEGLSDGSCLPVTVIDIVAQERTNSLKIRYPRLDSICDLEALPLDVNSPGFEEGRFLDDGNGRGKVTCAYVCLDDDPSALSTALTLHHRLRGRQVPIVVRMAYEGGLGTLLARRGASAEYENLHAFGLLEKTCKPDLLEEGIRDVLARAIHEHYVEKREAELEELPPEERPVEREPAMEPWERLDEEYKYSNRHQARHIPVKLRAVGCVLAPLTDWDAAEGFEFSEDESNNEVELLAQMEHERWKEERESRGWKPGPRDRDAKTTPFLIPWDELPPYAQNNARNTARVLPQVLSRAGFQIRRGRTE